MTHLIYSLLLGVQLLCGDSSRHLFRSPGIRTCLHNLECPSFIAGIVALTLVHFVFISLEFLVVSIALSSWLYVLTF